MLSVTSKFAIKFPLWVTFIVVSRDAIILIGALVIYIVKQQIDIYPTRWGKLTTTFQMLAVTSVLLQFRFSYLFWYLAVFLTVISGMDYIKRGFRALYVLDNPRNNN
jgi:phosphatidylglycerophosphate synthase